MFTSVTHVLPLSLNALYVAALLSIWGVSPFQLAEPTCIEASYWLVILVGNDKVVVIDWHLLVVTDVHLPETTDPSLFDGILLHFGRYEVFFIIVGWLKSA